VYKARAINARDTLALMKKIKMAMDPLDLMNPGKILDFEKA